MSLPAGSSRKSFFDFEITHFDTDSLVEHCLDTVAAGDSTILLPMNADCFNRSRRHPAYRRLLASRRFPVYPDGAGVILGLRFLGQPGQPRIATTDLVLHLLAALAQRRLSYRIGFLGGTGGVAGRARRSLNERFGVDSVVLDLEPPLIGDEDLVEPFQPPVTEIVERLRRQPVDMLFVGLGCPKQELFSHALLGKVPVKVFIPCGGLFSYYADVPKRAPRWMQGLALEWLHRLWLEPRRLWRRYLIGNPLFLLRLVAERCRLLVAGGESAG